jgi:hypothetical protein
MTSRKTFSISDVVGVNAQTVELDVPPGDEVVVRRVRVTRHMAQQWLALNIENNRHVSESIVVQYSSDMDAGRWLLTGDTIKFNNRGQMFDGQQRLMALLRSKRRHIDFMVAYNVEPEAVHVTDAGRKRTFAHTLGMEEVPNRILAAAIVRRVICWTRGNYVGGVGRGTNRYAVPTSMEMLEFYRKHRDVIDTASARGRDIQVAKLGTGAQAGFIFWLLSEISYDEAHTFFDMVLTGADIPLTHPALTLRNRLARREDPPLHQSVLWVRAWNRYRRDETMEKIYVTNNPSGINNENFPKPI